MPLLDPAARAVLFDLDDTLCDYRTAREARLRIAFTLGTRGTACARDDQELDEMIALSIEMHPHGADHFPELFLAFGVDDPQAADIAAKWYCQNRFHGLELFPDVQDVLRALRTQPSPERGDASRAIGIVTNGPTDVQRAKVALLGLEDLVDFVIISEEFGVPKPDPQIFREALRLASATPEEAVFIGDSAEFDIAGARAAGITTIWVNPAGMPWPGPGPAPSHEIRSLRQLPLLIGCTMRSPIAEPF